MSRKTYLIDTKTTSCVTTYGAWVQQTWMDSRIQTPPWSLVLSYEHAVRKRAYSLMLTERLMLGAALEKAWKCPTTKERHFITPLALYSKRAYPQNNNLNAGNWNPKGKGKGKSKSKGFQKGSGQGPDGEKICYRFNAGKCNYQKCKFAHMCNKCFKKGHTALNCKEKTTPDTTGTWLLDAGVQKVSQNTDTCKVLYLFSGCARKGSVSFWTRKLAAKWQLKVQIDMVDIKVRPHLDVTKRAVQQSLLNKIKAGVYAAIILSPPCSTFTRATFSNRRGPRPVRTFVHLRGLPRLTWSERKKANWGNVMTDFSYEVCKAVRKEDTIL